MVLNMDSPCYVIQSVTRIFIPEYILLDIPCSDTKQYKMRHALLTIHQCTHKEDDGHAMSENNVNYKQHRAAKKISTMLYIFNSTST
jgi:hypothetical protein